MMRLRNTRNGTGLHFNSYYLPIKYRQLQCEACKTYFIFLENFTEGTETLFFLSKFSKAMQGCF
jgi:hypothetical protein